MNRYCGNDPVNHIDPSGCAPGDDTDFNFNNGGSSLGDTTTDPSNDGGSNTFFSGGGQGYSAGAYTINSSGGSGGKGKAKIDPTIGLPVTITLTHPGGTLTIGAAKMPKTTAGGQTLTVTVTTITVTSSFSMSALSPTERGVFYTAETGLAASAFVLTAGMADYAFGGIFAGGILTGGSVGGSSTALAVAGAAPAAVATVNALNGQVGNLNPVITGRGPLNLMEEMTMEAAMNGKGTVIMSGPFGDALFKDPGWVKIQLVTRGKDSNAVVHYMYNTITGQTAQFKFKD